MALARSGYTGGMSDETKRPPRFHLWQLFALMAVAAVLVTPIGPALRGTEPPLSPLVGGLLLGAIALFTRTKLAREQEAQDRDSR